MKKLRQLREQKTRTSMKHSNRGERFNNTKVELTIIKSTFSKQEKTSHYLIFQQEKNEKRAYIGEDGEFFDV